MKDNIYTLFYAVVLCAVSSALLALASTALKPRQEANKLVDKQKNILMAAGLYDRTKTYSNEEITTLFKEKLTEVKKEIKVNDKVETRIFYTSSENSKVNGYIIPVSGKGLWSTLYGYLALKEDLNTVKGITFYEHGETPGLGGEIEKEWFQNNFVDKKVKDANGNVVGITVCKGKAKDTVKADQLPNAVDGISGATLTANGVTALIEKGVKEYMPLLKESR